MIYLDHHATTPVHPDVWREMSLYAHEHFHNPSGLGSGSLRVQQCIREAATAIKAHLRATSHEVVFTSGATEANNLALKCFHGGETGGAVLVSPIEHKSVIATSDYLAARRVPREWLVVDGLGQVVLDDLEARLARNTALVSIMAVNNEVGTVAQIERVAALCEAHGALFHCDATQAIDNMAIDLARTPIDLLSLSAHKIHGPKGAGCLLVSANALERFRGPHIHGGAQQSGLRAGTENVSGIVGLAKAMALAARDFESNLRHRRAMRNRLLDGLRAQCAAMLNGDPVNRHPGNVHVSFPGVSPQRFFSGCKGIAFSTGSACNSATGEPSHVLRHMGLGPEAIKSSMRLCVGAATTPDEVDAAIDIIARARSASLR